MSRRRNNSGYRAWMNDRVYVEPRMLPSHLLVLDEAYQRRVNMGRVDLIVENFNPYLVSPLKVSHRDGRYYIVDGGHTLMALKKVNADKRSFLVECRVYENMTKEEELLTFAGQTGFSKPITVREEMNALELGKDRETMAIIQATEDAGVTLAIRERPEKSIRAIGKVRNMYRKYGEDLYSDALVLIMDTWNGENGCLYANIIGGVVAFLNAFGSEYVRERFIRKLKVCNPKDILSMAKRHKTVYQTLDSACATEIAAIYNKGRGAGKLESTIVV